MVYIEKEKECAMRMVKKHIRFAAGGQEEKGEYNLIKIATGTR